MPPTEILSEINFVIGGTLLAAPVSRFIPDRIVPATDGEPVDLWVYAVLPKEGWVPHSPGDFTRAEHPGSAIRYRDQIYEVMLVEETVEGEYAFRYRLRPWDKQYTIRHLVDYTLKTQRDAADAHQEMAGTERLRSWILWLFPIAGFAPDPLQREWEKRTGLSMGWISFGSALCGLALAFSLRDSLGDSRFAAIVFYLALESFARLLWIAVSHRPHGSPLLTLPYLLWQGVQRRRHPEYTYPRSADRQKAVEDFTHRLDLAQSFSLVWGAYPRRDQLRLQLLYHYEGPRFTAITAGFFLVAGVLQVCLTAALYRASILALAGPAYLILESLYRLYRARVVSEPAGSMVGYILRLVIPPPR